MKIERNAQRQRSVYVQIKCGFGQIANVDWDCEGLKNGVMK